MEEDTGGECCDGVIYAGKPTKTVLQTEEA